MKYYRNEQRDIFGRVVYRETITEDEHDKRHIIEKQEPLFNLLKDRTPQQQQSDVYHGALAVLWIVVVGLVFAFGAVSIYNMATSSTQQEQSK